MSASLISLLPVIAEGAAAIESAFLSAGQGLSQGLDAFRSLNDDLKGLGTELDTGSMAVAATGLTRMTASLRDVGERLPVDSKVLDSLLDTNKGLTRRFDDLIGDMRMMVVVSRSARLEAVASEEQRVSLEAFSRTIDEQIGAVQRRIDQCAADHGKLTAMLARAARDHFAFDTGFGTRLASLASELDEALSLMGQRRAAGLALMNNAVTRARAISQAAGTALVSLQIGDNTRQRLEHVHYGLTQAHAMAAAGSGTADVAMVGLLCRLQEAQLRDTVASFEEEGASILRAFAILGLETADLLKAGRATSGRDGDASTSPLAQFKARLTDALDIVAACDASRGSVAGTIDALGAMLYALDATLAALKATSEELIIVAMNVGLKAGRLGARGRGLVSVAAELKRLSSQISTHTDRLLDSFGAVRRDAEHFGPAGRNMHGDSPSLASETRAILAEIARGDAQLADILASVDRTGRDFDVTVAGAAQEFEATVADTIRLTAVADEIGEIGGAARVDDHTRLSAAEAVDDLMLPLYSMTQERDIHATIVGERPTDTGDGFVDWAA